LIFWGFSKGLGAGFSLSPSFGFAGCFGLVEHKFFDFLSNYKGGTRFLQNVLPGRFELSMGMIITSLSGYTLQKGVLVGESIT
jgi:hypothetical protein